MSRIPLPWPAAPTANQYIALVNRQPKTPGPSNLTPVVGQDAIHKTGSADYVEIVWLQNDQDSAPVNAVRVYALNRARTAWYEVDCPDDDGQPTVGANANPTINVLALVSPKTRRLLIDVSAFTSGWAIEYQAGPIAPTAWDGLINVSDAVEAMAK